MKKSNEILPGKDCERVDDLLYYCVKPTHATALTPKELVDNIDKYLKDTNAEIKFLSDIRERLMKEVKN